MFRNLSYTNCTTLRERIPSPTPCVPDHLDFNHSIYTLVASTKRYLGFEPGSRSGCRQIAPKKDSFLVGVSHFAEFREECNGDGDGKVIWNMYSVPDYHQS